jgi:uncharacterized coiled-coil DUF342 family protein
MSLRIWGSGCRNREEAMTMKDKIKFLLKGGIIVDQFDCLEELLEDIDDIEEDDMEIADVLDEMDDFDTDFSDISNSGDELVYKG